MTTAAEPGAGGGPGTRPPRATRLAELALATGFAPLLLPTGWLLRRLAGLDDAEYAAGFLTFHGAHVVNDPHFAVTYLLFYADVRARALGRAFPPLQRARYWLAGAVVPLALAAWAVLAVRAGSAPALGWLMELMFLLVGWHYVKQGFGVLAVLSAREGRPLGPPERRALLAHAYAGWAFAWSNPSAPSREVEEHGVVYRALAHPQGLELVAGAAFALSTAWALGALAARRRRGEALPLGPLAAFAVTVWALTIFTSIDPVFRYFVPAAHSIQYLFFVWLLTRNRARAEEGPPHFGRSVGVRVAARAAGALALGYLLFHGLPGFLDAARGPRPPAPEDLGPTPWAAALFAVVNIHHYFLDGVIWRRENAETRFLVGPR